MFLYLLLSRCINFLHQIHKQWLEKCIFPKVLIFLVSPFKILQTFEDQNSFTVHVAHCWSKHVSWLLRHHDPLLLLEVKTLNQTLSIGQCGQQLGPPTRSRMLGPVDQLVLVTQSQVLQTRFYHSQGFISQQISFFLQQSFQIFSGSASELHQSLKLIFSHLINSIWTAVNSFGKQSLRDFKSYLIQVRITSTTSSSQSTLRISLCMRSSTMSAL